ncbi:MAG: MarR family winged helix-turn-helix transcriptional regulator [Verrucomicrobia bacterium]|nr:MarR family winged helix-turn-helix transcriptional regulator [Verrucomicrobiota bacterium]
MPPPPKPARRLPLDAPGRRRLPPLLRRAWYSLNQAFRRRLAHLGGLTPDQFTVLRTLTENDPEGLSQRELTDLMSSDPNTMASLLERMEAAGLLERHRHERDRRAYRIRLRPGGRRAFRQGRQVALMLQSEVLSALPEARREEFLTHLGIVADACHAAAEGVPKARTEGAKQWQN